MNPNIYNDTAIDKQIELRFGEEFNINKKFVMRNLPVGQTAVAYLFLTEKNQLFLFIKGQSKLLLSDIKKIVSHMGFIAENYIVPAGKRDYFNTIGKIKFQEVFPGRHCVTDNDLYFYKTLAPYNPALVQIKCTKNDVIFQYDNDSINKWRPAAKFSYRHIKAN